MQVIPELQHHDVVWTLHGYESVLNDLDDTVRNPSC